MSRTFGVALVVVVALVSSVEGLKNVRPLRVGGVSAVTVLAAVPAHAGYWSAFAPGAPSGPPVAEPTEPTEPEEEPCGNSIKYEGMACCGPEPEETCDAEWDRVQDNSGRSAHTKAKMHQEQCLAKHQNWLKCTSQNAIYYNKGHAKERVRRFCRDRDRNEGRVASLSDQQACMTAGMIHLGYMPRPFSQHGSNCFVLFILTHVLSRMIKFLCVDPTSRIPNSALREYVFITLIVGLGATISWFCTILYLYFGPYIEFWQLPDVAPG